MSVRNALVLLLALSSLMFLGACGGGGNTATATPPPTGSFSASSLNGTYVFSTSGVDINGAVLDMAGSLTANGSGSITTGAVDLVGVEVESSTFGEAVSGSYSVGVDGRGQIKFNLATTDETFNVVLDFVLSSSSHGLITEFDGDGSGSGTIDLQSAVSQTQLANASYTFGLAGSGINSNPQPVSTVGTFTLDSTGATVVSGQEDVNDAFIASSSTLSSSTLNLSSTPGSLTITEASTGASYTFDVYPIDNTHLKLIETDGVLAAAGDAFTAATSLPASGTLAFTMAGLDASEDPLGIGGLMPLDGSSNILSGAIEDYNDAGTVNQDSTFTGGFSALSAGRSELSLNGFVNGAANDLANSYTFAAYPFTSNGVTGVEVLEIDDAGVTSGVGYLQTGTTFAASQGYGLNLSGANGNGEEDDIAEFTTTSTAFAGVIDLNNVGTTTFAQSISGNYTSAGTGYYNATSNQIPNFNLYAVNGSTFLLLETTSSNATSGPEVATGIVELQNPSASPGPEPGIFSPARSASLAHAMHQRKK